MNFDLMDLMDKYGSDKGTKFDGHNYCRVYETFFSVIKDDPLILVELGLCCAAEDQRREICAVDDQKYLPMRVASAPSLRAWREYFPNAWIYGFDCDDFSEISLPNCQIIQGNTGSQTDLQCFAETIGQPIDIVIDDASHLAFHQQLAFAELFPYLQEGGIYFIEDLHYQPPSEDVSFPKTKDLLQKFSSNKTWNSPICSQNQQRYIQERIAHVCLFDTWSNTTNNKNALGVIRKKWNWL